MKFPLLSLALCSFVFADYRYFEQHTPKVGFFQQNEAIQRHYEAIKLPPQQPVQPIIQPQSTPQNQQVYVAPSNMQYIQPQMQMPQPPQATQPYPTTSAPVQVFVQNCCQNQQQQNQETQQQ
ncbi:hypothetical protein CCZ01_01720 [Helicobacter monodelphidis]|uniref:hypothetical protein n=1 Tax=Helicobacter sp. 15-1451 TaxID=2004995 RepID=UPI000DCE1126|nr:hypothetical protein [Helicobacter sp. 15-1451]RAX58935.1 hypothetical protein CCZ01_01720 [Helicobacter sp. 15-1451]